MVEFELSGNRALARVIWRLEVAVVCSNEGLVSKLEVVERPLFAWVTWKPTQVEMVMDCDAIRLVLIGFKNLGDTRSSV